MHIRRTPLDGVLIIEPQVKSDERGFFLETYRADSYQEAGILERFVQDNHSKSARHTLRGLHWQWRRPQGKLVRVIEGAIFDVAVDLRPGSATFGAWFAEELSAANFLQMYIPPEFAHGFYVISDGAQVEYKCTDFYDAGGEKGLIWNDPDVGIPWPLSAPPLLSDRDERHPRFVDLFGRTPAAKVLRT